MQTLDNMCNHSVLHPPERKPRRQELRRLRHQPLDSGRKNEDRIRMDATWLTYDNTVGLSEDMYYVGT